MISNGLGPMSHCKQEQSQQNRRSIADWYAALPANELTGVLLQGWLPRSATSC